MFTVIIADKESIKLFEETKMFFGPLFNSEKLAFCEWDKEAATIDEMVTGLYDIVEYKSEWRALIVYDDCADKLNPFDFTCYSEPYYNSKKNFSWEDLSNRRKQRIEAYERAVSNPLLKLTTALCGINNINSILADNEYDSILNDSMLTYEFMLKRQLDVVNCSELAIRLSRYQRDSLKRFVSDDKIDLLTSMIKNYDVSGICKLIPDTEIIEFIRLIGNDPLLCDPEYAECMIENTKKHQLLMEISDGFSIKDKLPSEVICVSTRTFDFEKVKHEVKWKKKDELSSSKFTNYNLYNDKLRFIIFDVLPPDHKQYKFDQIKFLCLLLIIGNNDFPQGAICANNVYRAQIEFDNEIVTRICENFVSKLNATRILLKEIAFDLDNNSVKSIDNKTAQKIFESDIVIPVNISADNNENDLYAEYSEIGLSTDCPKDETQYWSQQYREINKKFLRYLREPRRAVKTAVSDNLRQNNFINDDRSLFLNENQIEDIQINIDDLEQRMVETSIIHLFNTKAFTEQIDDANKEIRRGISQRMTKKKTLTVGLVAVLAYAFGFLPLIFGNFNTSKSFLFSLMLTGICVAVFALVGVFDLFSLRSKLVNRFKHFNYVMSGICSQIHTSLSSYSSYISSVCNLMRDFSILKKRDSEVMKKKKILSYHDIRITEQLDAVFGMFSKYVDFNNLRIVEISPYEYDFTQLVDYEFPMPDIHYNNKIEFFEEGYEITIPVDYVESVKLTREELYD